MAIFGLPTRPPFLCVVELQLYWRICFASIFLLWMFFYFQSPVFSSQLKEKEKKMVADSCGWPVKKEERVLFFFLLLFGSWSRSIIGFSFFFSLSCWDRVFYLVFFFIFLCNDVRPCLNIQRKLQILAGGKSAIRTPVQASLTVAKLARQRFLYSMKKRKKKYRRRCGTINHRSDYSSISYFPFFLFFSQDSNWMKFIFYELLRFSFICNMAIFSL